MFNYKRFNHIQMSYEPLITLSLTNYLILTLDTFQIRLSILEEIKSLFQATTAEGENILQKLKTLGHYYEQTNRTHYTILVPNKKDISTANSKQYL